MANFLVTDRRAANIAQWHAGPTVPFLLSAITDVGTAQVILDSSRHIAN
jgi:hypothetical protein